MDSKNLRQLGRLLATCLFLTSIGCGKDCVETTYNFNLPLKAYPNKDTIKVGDSIWVEIDVANSFVDAQSQKIIDYSNAENLGSFITFQKITGSAPDISDAVDSLTIETLKGKLLRKVPLGLEYNFVEENNRYLFKIVIIARKRGTYRFGFSNSNNTFRKTDKCTKANFNINFIGTNQHFYLFPGGAGTPQGGSAYYFHVR
jgi:hypothetical protein